MFRNLERYIELYNRLGVKTKVVNNILWREYQRMVVPVGPVSLNYDISKKEAEFLLSEFPKALMVRFTCNFNIPSSSEWYAVICKEFTDISELPSNIRSEIRRGLRNCYVEMVDAEYIAKYGYDVYCSSFRRYKNAKPVDKRHFTEQILSTKDFGDIVHYWAVFEKAEGKLIAYSQNYLYDKIEVNYSNIKFHPDYLKLYPSYALIYQMNKFYLRELQYEYVNDGFRNILHETGIQDYLIKKFGFVKVYTNLRIFYRPYLFIYLSVTYPFRRIFGKFHPKLFALYKQEEIRRKSWD